MWSVGSECSVVVKEWCFGFGCESGFLDGNYVGFFRLYIVFELVSVGFDSVYVDLDYFEV